MTIQFDLIESLRLKDCGITASENGYGAYDWVLAARGAAFYLAAADGSVTINDVLRFCPKPPHVSSNAIGSVMRDKRFKCIGYQPTSKISGHGRIIKIWALK